MTFHDVPGWDHERATGPTLAARAAAAFAADCAKVQRLVTRHLTGADQVQVLGMLFDDPKSLQLRTPLQLSEGTPLPDDVKQRIRALAATGLADSAIAEQLGVSRQAVTGVRTHPAGKR